MTVFVVVMIYLVLSNFMLAFAIKLSNGNIWRFLIAKAIFDIIFFIDLPLILPSLEGVCQ
jgi:hypothetical protein